MCCEIFEAQQNGAIIHVLSAVIVKQCIFPSAVSGLQQPTKPLATVPDIYKPIPGSLYLFLQIKVPAFCRSRCMLLLNFVQTRLRTAFRCVFCCKSHAKAANDSSFQSKGIRGIFDCICCA